MLITKTKTGSILWGIWKIEESIDELYSILNNPIYETDIYLQKIGNKEKLREKLAVRVLLKTLLASDITIIYKETGKPLLRDSSLQISVSHTKGYAAIAISEKGSIGIDIEKISNKVEAVRSKFVNSTEYISEDEKITHLLLHWSAKESIYKVLNKKGIDLKNDISIDSFSTKSEGFMRASAKNLEKNVHFEIEYIVRKKYVLTLAYIKN